MKNIRYLMVCLTVASVLTTFSSFADTLSIDEITSQAEQGNATAQYQLYRFYETGHLVPRDDTKSVFWLKKAAEQHYSIAEAQLGTLYAGGRQGLPEDEPEADKWYKKAVEDGSSSAKFIVAFRDSSIIKTLPQWCKTSLLWTALILLVLIFFLILGLLIYLFWRVVRKRIRKNWTKSQLWWLVAGLVAAEILKRAWGL
jgi:TPR repeat protein